MANTKDLKKTTQVGTITGLPPIIPPISAGVPLETTNPTNSVTGTNTIVYYHPPKGNGLA